MHSIYIIALSLSLAICLVIARVPLFLAFIAISVAIAIASGNPMSFPRALYEALEDPLSRGIILVAFLIAMLVALYRRCGAMDRLSEELVKLFKKPIIVLTTVPAILGLLPIAGGALISAPIVDRVGDSVGLSKAEKLFVNVWFRHILFLFYPLSTTVILASALGRVDLWVLVLRQIPIAIAMAFIGIVLVFAKRRARLSIEVGSRGIDMPILLKSLSPIAIAIALALALSPIVDPLELPIKRFSLVVALTVAIVLLSHLNSIGIRSIVDTLREPSVWELVALTYTAMVLRFTFTSLDTSDLSSMVMGSAIPLDILAIAIPIVLGLSTGLASTAIVVSIPLLSSIAQLDSSTVSLIYTSALLGYLGSPMHLCYVYTAQYLGIPLAKGYRYMVPAVALSLAIAYTVNKLF